MTIRSSTPTSLVRPSTAAKPSTTLETFANPAAERDYTIRMSIPEFTCLCPKTGQPDFATLELEYVPDALCVELKSLKLYIWSFRDRGAFHEAVTNEILDHLAAGGCAPLHAPDGALQRPGRHITPPWSPSTARRAGDAPHGGCPALVGRYNPASFKG